MHGNAENISTALSNVASSKAAGAGATLIAGGVVVNAKDPQTLGNLIDTVSPAGQQELGRFLATNGPALFGDPLLSWAEMATVAGSLFVTYQLVKIIIAIVKDLISASVRFYNFCIGFKRKPVKIKPKGATNAQNTKTRL